MDISIVEEDFLVVPASFGGTASFSSLSHSVKLNDSYSQRMLKGINSLSMSLDLKFNQLTDLETRTMISFLQKNFYYEPQEYNTVGVFTNKRIEPFDYTPFYPYKANKFFCLSYAHNIETHNVNNITATFTCAYPSTLLNNEPPAGGGGAIASQFNIRDFNNLKMVIAEPGAALTLKKGNYIYLDGGYKNYKLTTTTNPPRLKSDSDDSIGLVSVDTTMYDLNSADLCVSQHSDLRHSIFIENPNDCSYYPYKPKTATGDLDFRMFDFRPSEGVKISHSPKYKTSSVNDFYKKFNKYGYNHNLSNLSLNFNGRSDLETKRILLFLESHMGYKKFHFHLNSQYSGNSSTQATSPNQKRVSTFYCPEWSHTFKYRNNHEISATFIECV